MKYEEALEYMDLNIAGLGSVPGLDSVRELSRRMGNPHLGLKYIHVAGTNGKGSISTFIAKALEQSGYRVGRYISPVISDYRERIQVNSSMIPKTKVAAYLTELYAACDEMVKDGLPHPTAFEIETVMAFMFFTERKCDVVVLECGMGGTLDATNIIENPLLCVFASISLDHMSFLGDTLEQIAKSKSGIIKPGCIAVSAPLSDGVKDVLSKKCSDENVPLYTVDKALIKVKKTTPEKTRFDFGSYRNIDIPLGGEYQPENAATALLSLEALAEKGMILKEDKIREGFMNAVWPARFELVGKKPYLIADGAHNIDAVKRLMNSVSFHFTNRRIVFIMGVLKDKEYSEMIEISAPMADCIVTLTPPNPARALHALKLAEAVREVNKNVTAADSVNEALEEAALLAGDDGVIIAFGSLSYMGLLKTEYEKRFGKNDRRSQNRRSR